MYDKSFKCIACLCIEQGSVDVCSVLDNECNGLAISTRSNQNLSRVDLKYLVALQLHLLYLSFGVVQSCISLVCTGTAVRIFAIMKILVVLFISTIGYK